MTLPLPRFVGVGDFRLTETSVVGDVPDKMWKGFGGEVRKDGLPFSALMNVSSFAKIMILVSVPWPPSIVSESISLPLRTGLGFGCSLLRTDLCLGITAKSR